MDWQQLTSLTIVAVAATLLAWGRLRRPKMNFQRATHCGCGSGSSGSAASSIVFRARKGERPVVQVKMR